MDNSNNLELEILINVRQNKKIPINEFYKLFEHRWIFYVDKFCELNREGLFVPVQVANLTIYQLTPMGKTRIARLIEKREQEISLRILHLKQLHLMRYSSPKPIMTLLKSILHFRTSSQTIAESKTAMINNA